MTKSVFLVCVVVGKLFLSLLLLLLLMFERVGIDQKIREDMKDDEELEMLLGEIPHATSLNLHHPQSNAHHVHGFVKPPMNGMIYGKYDDDPSSYYKYSCPSPVSGFSLQSDGSSSGLLSGGHSSSDNGSPTPPPLEELKPQFPYGNSHHPNGLLMDFKVPDSPIGKTGNENFIDELNLSRKFGRMYISGEQENFSVDPNGVRLFDHSIRANNRTGLGKYGAPDNYMRGFSGYGGPHSSVPRNPMCFDGEMNSALSGLQCDYRSDNLMGFQYPSGRDNGLFSQPNCSNNSPLSFPCHGMKQANNYYPMGFPSSNLVGSATRPSVADALFYPQQFYPQQNGVNLNEERGSVNMPHTTHPWPHLGVETMLDCSPPMLNGRTRAPSNIRIPQGGFTSEDSLIIQDEGLNFVMNTGFGRPRGRNSKVSSHVIGVEKPQQKMSQLHGQQFPGICENGRSGRLYCSFALPPKCNSLAEARAYIYLMAKDQHGCRFLQRMFDEGTPQDVQIIFNEIIDHVVELMMNPFGNYLMQKLLIVCNEEQVMQILLVITEEPGQLVRISLNTHGTRVVQKLIETLKTRQQISLVISALEPGFLALIKDLNGNHVVQRCLQCLSDKDNKRYVCPSELCIPSGFIFVAAAKYCVDIATHQHGCCVLQRCINHSTGEHLDNLVTEISANGLLLAQDAFGNYVVQFILELKIPSATSSLISQFEGNYVHLSTQKFSSHVVEKCLLMLDDETRPKIIHELLSASHFEQLLQDPHANYVVQTALRVSEGSLHNLLVDAIESRKAISRNNPYSKRIFSQKLLKK
ncbi:unnamed protein product [Camellia sinensis]